MLVTVELKAELKYVSIVLLSFSINRNHLKTELEDGATKLAERQTSAPSRRAINGVRDGSFSLRLDFRRLAVNSPGSERSPRAYS